MAEYAADVAFGITKFFRKGGKSYGVIVLVGIKHHGFVKLFRFSAPLVGKCDFFLAFRKLRAKKKKISFLP